eukprot:NODE_13925_length_461_cov_73.757396_g13631_i0.p1 GENE.NODE_13925_length_461_cov_73.757396_g13631_i0~~NODE_13925_length_461_cov_73.757396_g13631_i0.p1  ORF type:complete len:108 (-),score=5.35 NODE_13925_length_461_cov_73.757396_g13631_i0:80-403(-)
MSSTAPPWPVFSFDCKAPHSRCSAFKSSHPSLRCRRVPHVVVWDCPAEDIDILMVETPTIDLTHTHDRLGDDPIAEPVGTQLRRVHHLIVKHFSTAREADRPSQLHS